MKHAWKQLILSALLAACCALSACGGEEREELFRVVLSETAHVRCEERVKEVREGGSAAFALTFDEGYAFGSADRDCRTEETEAGFFLIVENVRRSRCIEVAAREIERMFEVELKCAGESQFASSEEGGDVTFLIKGSKTPTKVGYAGDYSFFEYGDSCALTLKEIKESAVVELSLGEGPVEELFPGQRAIRYEYGCADAEGALSHTEVTVFPRVNSALGEGIERKGYTLVGWRTPKGERIGLGSRIPDAGSLTLEGIWEEWTKESSFEYVLADRSEVCLLYAGEEERKTASELAAMRGEGDAAAIITRYVGNEETLVLPGELGGCPVRAVAQEAATFRPNLRAVVLNRGLEYVAPRAFSDNHNLKEVCLFDDLEHMHGTCFDGTVETLYLNAVLPPVYGTTENGQVGNKIALLQEHEGGAKLVLFGGCSIWYGINGKTVEEVLGGQYAVYNMGVIGGTCALYQIDLIRPYLEKGDIFVHLPELISLYQLLGDVSFDGRVYMGLECNYDLLAQLDLTRYRSVFTGLRDFLEAKRTLMSAEDYVPRGYRDGLDYMDERGNMTNERKGGYDNAGSPYYFLQTYELNNWRVLENLAREYGQIAEGGVRIFTGIPPVNADGADVSAGEELVSQLKQGFLSYNVPSTFFMELEDALYEGKYFYDANYHLSSEGARLFTERFLQKLSKVLSSRTSA